MIELLLQAERSLSVGMLDRAEQLYRQVANADPRNSIAVVGLARVTLDRGDDVGALELSKRALTIDPENDAARRMVARLEEVLEYRESAESLLFDRHEAVSALQADVAADVAAEVGALAVRSGEPDDATETDEAADLDQTTQPVAASDASGSGRGSETGDVAQPAADAVHEPAAEVGSSSPESTAETAPSAAPWAPAAPPWASTASRAPEPPADPSPGAASEATVEPQLPADSNLPSQPAEPDPTSTDATAPTGLLAYLDRLFRRR